jgi:MFS family permease
MSSGTRVSRRGNAAHRFYSVVVFVVLASLDNVAIGLIPPLYGPISGALGVSQRLLGLVTAVSFLVSALAAVAWAYVGDRTDRKPLLMVGTLIWARALPPVPAAEGW